METGADVGADADGVEREAALRGVGINGVRLLGSYRPLLLCLEFPPEGVSGSTRLIDSELPDGFRDALVGLRTGELDVPLILLFRV